MLGLAVVLAQPFRSPISATARPGARAGTVLALAAPLTLAVVTLAMSDDGDVLFPLLFTSVCWSALSLRRRQVVADVLATIAVCALPLIARSLGWEAGHPAEGVGLLLASTVGFALVGAVVYRLAEALRQRPAGLRCGGRRPPGRARDLRAGRPHRPRQRAHDARSPGFSEDELVGASAPLPYWPPESVDDARGHGRGRLAARARRLRRVFCRKNGERFPAIVTAGVAPGDGSRVVMIKDVAERAELMAETHEPRARRSLARPASSASTSTAASCSPTSASS